jgi:hypothetical protein
MCMQAELDKKTILLKSISDRINPDTVRGQCLRQSPPCGTIMTQTKENVPNSEKSASRKKKRNERNERCESDRNDDAADKRTKRCVPSFLSPWRTT